MSFRTCLLLFQFQTGAIKSHPSDACVTLWFFCFNSKLVRLKASLVRASHCRCGARFNSKLVRLKATLEISFADLGVGFNSKLVRLKAYVVEGINLEAKFQFQTGAIKSKPTRTPTPRTQAGFNSKLVRLKGDWVVRQNLLDTCSFNSKLVRLKVA